MKPRKWANIVGLNPLNHQCSRGLLAMRLRSALLTTTVPPTSLPTTRATSRAASSADEPGATATMMLISRSLGQGVWAAAGVAVNAAAMSYQVRGRQYVAIAAGNSLFAYALPER